MGAPKRSGKGRLDHYYKLAKEKGFRARSAFKLIQINRKYNFLQGTKVLIDLCAAPGGWLQVAAETLPPDSLIIGVDLVPIKPIPRVITIAGDITTDKCRAAIRQHLKTWKADTVLHDGSPHVGSAWLQDSFNQAELVLESLRLATDFLIEGGTFVTKIFRSKDYNPLLWVFNQLFATVEATKPPSSRNVSAEIFVICRGFKAPKRIDPRFLDPRAVFAELDGPAPNNEAKIYKPETKKRKRDGYEEGEYLQFKEIPASEFIHATDPIAVLANHNRFTFTQPANGDVALAALDRLPETTTDIRARCADLKVLGRGDFKALLKWRLRVRDLFGLASVSTPARPLSEQVATEEEAVEVEPMDEELRIVQELQELRERDSAKKKKERRRENERKQKDIIRMQMGMTAPMDIAKEQSLFAHGGEGTMFGIKALGQAGQDGALNKIARGKMAIIKESDPKDGGAAEFAVSAPSDHLDAADDDGDRLEESLDSMYENYKTKKAEVDAKYRAKRAREEHDDDDWEGLSVSDGPGSDIDLDLEMDDSDGTDDDDDADGPTPRQAQTASKDGLSRKAQGFFDQDIFREIPGLDQALAGLEVEPVVQQQQQQPPSKSEVPTETAPTATRKRPDSDMDVTEERNDEEDGWEDEPRRADGHFDIDLVTAEAMTLAQSLASGEKTRHDVVDDGFNKHAFRDRDGLPDWFVDDEKQHDKPHKPITKAASAAIQEKLRALNARPIKKVREAKARKKFKMAQKLEKLRKKSDVLASDEGMTEKEKAASISKLLRKAAKKKPRQPAQLVIAKGINKGVRGRPSGVAKGRRYKLVDARMKKDLRAQKRIAKRK